MQKLKKQDYRKYITSTEWEEKKRLYKKDHCQICNSKNNLDTHHLNYKNLGDETEKDLATLCRTCHKVFHLNMVKNKLLRSPSKAMAKFYCRYINGFGSTKNNIGDFLRRRWIVINGTNNLPDFKYFTKQAVSDFNASRQHRYRLPNCEEFIAV